MPRSAKRLPAKFGPAKKKRPYSNLSAWPWKILAQPCWSIDQQQKPEYPLTLFAAMSYSRLSDFDQARGKVDVAAVSDPPKDGFAVANRRIYYFLLFQRATTSLFRS